MVKFIAISAGICAVIGLATWNDKRTDNNEFAAAFSEKKLNADTIQYGKKELSTNTFTAFPADIAEGLIGVTASDPVDDPSDNIFHINVPQFPTGASTAILQYELYGVTDRFGIAASINDEQATGGQFVMLNKKWSSQEEIIPMQQLKEGNNVLRFTLPANASYSYRVKNVSLRFEKKSAPTIVGDINAVTYLNNLYLQGTVSGEVSSICYDNVTIPINNGSFELLTLSAESGSSIELQIKTTGEKIITKKIRVKKISSPDFVYSFDAKYLSRENVFDVSQSFTLQNAEANITIPAHALNKNTRISLTRLRAIDVPVLSMDMVNVTRGATAYRFLPHGINFDTAARLMIGYDSTLIPDGYTAADIRTYYFDEKLREWIELPFDSLISEKNVVVSRTTHFTDMINGIIKVPESPQTQAYTPTSIKDIKAANPSLGVDLMEAPAANSTGSAVLSFPVKLPKGRQGLEPDLQLKYNNEGSNGWMGLGWNISVPSIGIDSRWGVPRYDAALETETYTLNGEQLAPVIHRDALEARMAEKQFHPRVEGAFNKIIRHGNAPSNYWWDVINKNGTHNYYGGTPATGVQNTAVLKDDNGNIAYWGLVETRDLSNNFIHYFYSTVADPGLAGGNPGKQLYITRIQYTGFGSTEGAYKIEFIRDRDLGETLRKDIDISARLGFKMVTADRLRKINVSLNASLIRGYTFEYREGAFNKSLLQTVSQLDASGTIVYKHELAYYDDVTGAGGPLGTTENWSPANDNLHGDITLPLPGFTGEATALNSSKSSNTSQGLALCLGIWDGNISKSNTVGASFGSSSGSTEGLVTLVDINGDGLPDKVFKQNNRLYYRANLGITLRGFGQAREINGINNFSHARNVSNSRGFESNFFVFVGTESTKTTNTTTEFFSDFNGDGLIDIASNGTVYFNRLNANGDPTFLPTSNATPSPIMPGGNVNPAFLTPDPNLQAQQEHDYPLQDIVRMWEAPYSGIVNVTAPVQLLDVSLPGVANRKLDGVRVSIQLRGNIVWSTTIDASDFSTKQPLNVSGLNVTKGDRIYFRVESIYNGENDLVSWDPLISYTSTTAPAKDANKRFTNTYKASADFILNNAQFLPLNKDGRIEITGRFSKQKTSDTVRLMIIRKTGSVFDTIVSRTYACGEVVNSDIPATADVLKSDSIKFILQTDSYIDRAALAWTPYYKYTILTDGTPVTNINGRPTFQGYGVPDNTNYNDWVIKTTVYTNAVKDTVMIRPRLIANAGSSGKITFTIKAADTVIAKRTLQVVNGLMAGHIDSIYRIRPLHDSLYCEFHTSDRELALALQTVEFVEEKDSMYVDVITGNTIRVVNKKNFAAGLYTNPAKDLFGPLFRGWGHFSYKGSRTLAAIDESKLTLDGMNSYSHDPSQYTDTLHVNQIQDATLADFIALYPKSVQQSWAGYDSSVYVTKDVMGSARLWMHDVSVDSLMQQGSGLSVVNKITETNSRNYSLGIVVSATGSFSNTTNRLDMMDLNGDRYPDVLHMNDVQYTMPAGGLEAAARHPNVGPATFYGQSLGLSMGGAYPVAVAKSTTPQDAQNASQNSDAIIAVTGTGSVSANDDHVVTNWIDINGDGLPDKVFDDNKVGLNMGYRFAPREDWGLGNIEMNHSDQYSAGMGFSLFNGSFQGGYSLLRSNGSGSFAIEDINGDGLPEKLTNGGSLVELNNGHGFQPPAPWQGLNMIRKNTSVGQSENAAVTYAFPIPLIFIWLKIAINPSFGASNGIARETNQIMDIDGDGFPDLVHSTNDGNLIVQRSTIGRTNMLRSVKRPLGSAFAIDYERVGNTYEVPQSKWVMKSLEVTDGFRGDGIDTMRTNFSYANGLYNRDEREFYGFKTVTTSQLNTGAGNLVYRRSSQQFLNNDYHIKGLVEKEWTADAAGNKFTETEYQYDLRTVGGFSGVIFPAQVQKKELYYEGAPTAGVSTLTRFDYDAFGNVTHIADAGDNSQQDMLIATVIYHNNDPLYIKSVPAKIEVNTVAGLVRKRETSIDNTGSITQIRQFPGDGSAAVYDMTYDSYGNLRRITRPDNHKGQRLWYQYTYDNGVNTYVTKVEDAYGYSSTSTYDLRFGELTGTVSENNEPMLYSLDNLGRLVSIKGPYENAAGKPYTIAFEYHPEAIVPYAITRHYDPAHNADLNTVTFMDGLGRVLQVKKQAAIFKGKDQPDDIRMTVSGKVIYDAFGRNIETRFPVTEAISGTNSIFNTAPGNLQLRQSYDILDRNTQTVLADGSVSAIAYSINNGFLSTRNTDALHNVKETLGDVRGRKRTTNLFGGPNGTITTRFFYNALSELTRVSDNNGNDVTNTYDNLGRKTSVKHPEAGVTEYVYDHAGNMTKKITAQIRKEIPNGGAIQYQYDFERVTDIDYPRQYQNKVKYTYGKPGMGNRTGRLILQEDASGGQEFYYGKLGEVTKTIRTMVINNAFFATYISEQEYDTWNRVTKMVYPDGEVVNYHYNKSGGLQSIDGSKDGNNYKYINQLGYDEYEQRVYVQHGNGTETNYAYDNLRRRLISLKAVAAGGRLMMDNSYNYDPVDNVLRIVNNVQAVSGKLGGFADQNYQYDNLYRLTRASGEYKGAVDSSAYSLVMTYDNLYNIVRKQMFRTQALTSYDLTYKYTNGSPHQPDSIGPIKYNYDLNGNLLGSRGRQNFWDEENRLMAVINNGIISRYTYDAAGERAIKSSGGLQGAWVNGAPAGMINHDTNYVAYVSPYLVCRRTSFTKHIYIESQRVVTKMGHGNFTNISFPQAAITAGGINYLQRMADIQRQRISYYDSLHVSPGPPIDKYFYAQPYNSGMAAPVIIDSTSASIPRGWPGNTTPPTNGPPVFVNPIPSNDSVHAGYGFTSTGHFYEGNQYFYHPDHLGSTSYVSNLLGEVSQHQEYTPFGETFFEEHISSYSSPYLFNAKERDAETGLYYYGARYYDPRTSLWLGVDSCFDKYPDLSPYNYCLQRPIILTDPNGKTPALALAYTNPATAVIATAVIGIAIVATNPQVQQGFKNTFSAIKDAVNSSRPTIVKNEKAEEQEKAIDDILKGATPTKTKGRTKEYIKPGGVEQKGKDFDSVKPDKVAEKETDYGKGRVGELADGRKIVERPGSSARPGNPDGLPTLEIQKGKERIKIRYTD